MILFEINYFAVFVAAIIYLGVAALWYSPLLFSHVWLEENRMPASEMERRARLAAIGYAALAAVVLALGLALLIRIAGVANGVMGALMGLFAGALISAPAALPVYVFENRSLRLFLINEGMPVVALIVMGAVIGGWQ